MGREYSTNGAKRNAHGLVGKPERKSHYQDLHVGQRIILGWILRKEDGMLRNGLTWFWIGTSEHGNEPLDSITFWEILE
jgi:hypothetical protein